jgi:hypothetical protein
MMDTPDRKPLSFKISRAMEGIDIDWLSNAIKSLCKGWITSHEDKENQETYQEPSSCTQQGEGASEPPQPRNIPDLKECDTWHSNLAVVHSWKHVEYWAGLR